MNGKANPCGEFGQRCTRLRAVKEFATELTCADFPTWRPLLARHIPVQLPKMDVLVVCRSSLILLETISIPTIAEYCG